MFCSKCGKANVESVSFCRDCGASLDRESQKSGDRVVGVKAHLETSSVNPDELTSRGIRDVIIGDGVFMVAIVLGLTQSSVSNFLWLLLLIPAFFFFGKGIADVLHAKQMRRRQKEAASIESPDFAELPPARSSIAQVFEKAVSGELEMVPSVTERTTHKLTK